MEALESGALAQTAIETRQLAKIFKGNKKRPKATAVESIDLNIKKGEIFGLLGPNGAGKTTTIRMLTALIKPTYGEAWIEGASVLSDPQKVRSLCGVLTETPGLYSRLNAVEYLNFFGQLYGLSRDYLEHRVPHVLDMLGIEPDDRKNKRLGVFSRGMKQKMNIARAVLHDPPVLFLDEPTASLDPESAKVVRDYVLTLKDQQKRTILLCTHNLDEADRLCDRIAVIHKGKVMQIGRPDELKSRLGEYREYCIILADNKANDYLPIVQDAPGINMAYVGEKENEIFFRTKEPETSNPLIIQDLAQADAKMLTISEESHSLEEVYLTLMKEGDK